MTLTAEQRDRARAAEERIEAKISQFETLMRQLAPEGFTVTMRRTVGASMTVGVSLLVGPRSRRDGFERTLLEALHDAQHGQHSGALDVPEMQQGTLFEATP